MPIVLAIEPDRRQAAHLTAIVRHQVGAELVLADTTEGALDAIGNRVPDLVLVPALLSPQDDAALAAALRVIAAAAHVRTLTIPVLASGITRAPTGGMLAKWRKSRAASPDTDGCDPAVFGEQISTYLREAAAERAALEDDLIGDAPIDIAPPIPTGPTLRYQTPAPDAGAALEPAAVIEPPASPAPAEEPWAESIEPWAAEPDHAWAAEPVHAGAAEPVRAWAAEPVHVWAAESIDQPLIDLSEELAGLSDAPDDGELFDGERVGVYTISAQADEPAIEAFDLMTARREPPAIEELAAAAVAPAAEVEPEAPIVEPLPAFVESVLVEPLFAEPMFVEPLFAEPMFVEPVFVEPPEPLRADIEPWVPMYLTPGRMWPALEGMPAEMPVARTEQPDWIELVASLRQDLERRRTDPESAVADPIAPRPSDGPHAGPRRLVTKQQVHVKKAKPVQDEWGFFDPEQCGFSTLLAKLEEITEDGTGA